MRLTKFVVIASVLLIVAGSVLLYYDQFQSKNRVCERAVRKAYTAICTWSQHGETRVWELNLKENEAVFLMLQDAMLADLQAPREEKSSASASEYHVRILNRDGRYPCDFHINTGHTTWIECNGGTYPNQGHTQKFLRAHAKNFQLVPPETKTN